MRAQEQKDFGSDSPYPEARAILSYNNRNAHKVPVTTAWDERPTRVLASRAGKLDDGSVLDVTPTDLRPLVLSPPPKPTRTITLRIDIDEDEGSNGV